MSSLAISSVNWRALKLSLVAVFSPDGQQILSASGSTIRLQDAASGALIREFRGHSQLVKSLAFSPAGQHVLSGGEDASVRLWETASGALIREFKGHLNSVNSVAFSPDGQQVLSGSFDASIRLWDTASGRPIRVFQGRT